MMTNDMEHIRSKGASVIVALLSLLLILIVSGGCGSDQSDRSSGTDRADTDPQNSATQEFWTRLHEHCGQAFEGRLNTAAPGYDMLDGSERLIVHFRECSDFETRLPFHIEEEPDSWDRSRTWVFFNHGADGLELRHDHRHQDGSEEENTWYGGDAIEGGEYWQRFVYLPRTEEMGMFMGWRVEIHPGERYTYGTMRDDEWTFRVDFDLGNPVAPPPPPWGF